VSTQISEPRKLNLLVPVSTPVGRQGRIEQAIVRRFLEEFHGEPRESAVEPEPTPA
jgi:hypothetical protein